MKNNIYFLLIYFAERMNLLETEHHRMNYKFILGKLIFINQLIFVCLFVCMYVCVFVCLYLI